MKPEKSYLKPSILKQAIAVAMASDASKKMGAILLKRNRVIAAATNNYLKTHPLQYFAAQNAARVWGDPNLAAKHFLHAEVNALIKSREDADTIVVCRVGGHGGKDLRNSFCCPICYHYITEKCPTIKTIHWSTNNQDFRYIRI
jgi:deoxycytidylate deaminase